MKNSATTINESTIATSLNELAHALVRELAMAARKVGIYGSSHPMAVKAVEKPFLVFNHIFRFKRYVNINVSKGNLLVLNIRLKDSVFNEEIIALMQTLDISAILFEKCMTASEFSKFLNRIVKRVDRSDHSNLLGHYLRENRIDTIEVNTEKAIKFFEEQKQLRGDFEADFSVKHFVLERMGADLESLARLQSVEPSEYETLGIDFAPEIVEYLLPEKVASIPPAEIRNKLLDLAAAVETESDAGCRGQLVGRYRALYRLCDFHGERDLIIENLQEQIQSGEVPDDIAREVATPTTIIKCEVSGLIDEVLDQLLHIDRPGYSVDDFTDAFVRLLRTGQRGRAASIVVDLIGKLEAPEPAVRQRALDLAVRSIVPIDLATDDTIFLKTVEFVIDRLEVHEETYEYSEIIWHQVEKCLLAGRFDLMARLTEAMARRRSIVDSVTIYDSMAVKHSFGNINRGEVINVLIDEMIQRDRSEARDIQRILVAIGSEEVALALAHIITHPVRQVRQQSLKILAELGKASLKVFTKMLGNEALFERDEGRRELSDNKWYAVRNCIFVLGSLKDPEGVVPMRLRIGDSDVRVRREIVSALEKIGGEEAADLLIVMADDNDREIAERAIIAAGLVGSPDMVPLFIDVARRNPLLAPRCVSLVGNLGGEEARAYLMRLLTEEDELSGLAAGRTSKDDLRVAAIKALSHIGDAESLSSIESFRNSMSATQKILFKNSAVNKVLSEVLNRR